MKKILLALAVLAFAAVVDAAPIYILAVNTSSLSGTTGALDFRFTPGALTSQAAMVQISNITGGTYGTLSGSAFVYNFGVIGFLDTFTFGNTLQFNLLFGGPAVTSPSGSAPGSTFGFSIFTDSASTKPALTSTGLIATVQVNSNGTLTATSLSPNVSFIPEPASFALFGSGLAALAIWRKSRRKQ